jgi:hypothetical protein
VNCVVRAAVFAAVASAGGCREDPSVEPFRNLVSVPTQAPSSPRTVAEAGASDAGGSCPMQVEVSRPHVDESCMLYEHVTGTKGTLTTRCGDGPAEALFGETHFAGEMKQGSIDLVAEEEYDWRDGCRWRATQHIRGVVAHKQLVYKYSEVPVRGVGCLDACGATAFVKIGE